MRCPRNWIDFPSFIKRTSGTSWWLICFVFDISRSFEPCPNRPCLTQKWLCLCLSSPFGSTYPEDPVLNRMSGHSGLLPFRNLRFQRPFWPTTKTNSAAKTRWFVPSLEEALFHRWYPHMSRRGLDSCNNLLQQEEMEWRCSYETLAEDGSIMWQSDLYRYILYQQTWTTSLENTAWQLLGSALVKALRQGIKHKLGHRWGYESKII